MFSELFDYRHDLNVLLCRQCCHAVTNRGLYRHLQRFHHLSGSETMALLAHTPVEAAGCLGRDTANHPPNGGPPIPGLRPPVPGVACMECGYACVNVETMRRHLKERHPISHAPDSAGLQRARLWEPVQVQTLYVGPSNIVYFTVVPGATPLPRFAALPSPQAAPTREQVCVFQRVV
jgi:Orsellinic acid/F9775 biosynthesis cluster protein D